MPTISTPLFRSSALLNKPAQTIRKEIVPSMSPSDKNLNKSTFQHYKALYTPRIKFGTHHLTDKDYSINLDADYSLCDNHGMITHQALMLTSIYKDFENDSSHLKLHLSSKSENDNAASMVLASTLLFFPKPCDVIISSEAGPSSIPALMTARLYDGESLQLRTEKLSAGKAFIQPYASITLGPVKRYAHGDNSQQQAYQRIGNSQFDKRVELLMQGAGVTDFKKAYQDLESKKNYNALQALAYGKYGLVDAILIGKKKVLTRKNLEVYYQRMSFNDAQKEEFNERINHLDKIDQDLLIPLEEFSPGSVVSPSVAEKRTTYHSLLNNQVSPLNGLKIGKRPLSTFAPESDKATQPLGNSKRNSLFRRVDPPENLQIKVPTYEQPSYQISIDSRNKGLSIIEDTIYFSAQFDQKSIAQLIESIRALMHKKASELNPTNIQLIIDSPGGLVDSWRDVMNELKSHQGTNVGVDVTVIGKAYSCAALLVAGASGRRYVTPMGEVMIHNPYQGVSHSTSGENANQEANNMANVTKDLIDTIVDASGREFKAVEEDFSKTTYINAIDLLFYGKENGEKAFVHAIKLGPDKEINRDDVVQYLTSDESAIQALTETVQKMETLKHKQSLNPEEIVTTLLKSLSHVEELDKSEQRGFLTELLGGKQNSEPLQYTPEELFQKYFMYRLDTYHDPSMNVRKPHTQPTLFDNPMQLILKTAALKYPAHTIPINRDNSGTKRSVRKPTMDHFYISPSS